MPVNDNKFVNQETWNGMIRFYDDLLSMEHWEHLRPLWRLVKTVTDSERAEKFRAGQSLATLIISTTSYHGLNEEDPYIAVEMMTSSKDKASIFKFYYSGGAGNVAEKRICEECNALHVLDELLNRLWNDTKTSIRDH